jgi:hypothetical protein
MYGWLCLQPPHSDWVEGCLAAVAASWVELP